MDYFETSFLFNRFFEPGCKRNGIEKVALVKGTQMIPLKFEYDDWTIRIKLDKIYKANESYTIYIDYTAKPDEFDEKYGQNAMLGIKGMYFINPKGEVKNKPTQIWTQGETESSSAWFPTIDKTNQRCTQELTVTVDNKYVTLSNGKLVSQRKIQMAPDLIIGKWNYPMLLIYFSLVWESMR